MGIIQRSAKRIGELATLIPPLLKNISENEFSFKVHPGKWSKKEIIGHLIDSASNNHQRFIRSRVEEGPDIFYNQDAWNRLAHYNEMNSDDVIALWAGYNKLLAHIVSHMTEEDLERKCYAGTSEAVKLGFVVSDYVTHLEHHLRQVVDHDI